MYYTNSALNGQYFAIGKNMSTFSDGKRDSSKSAPGCLIDRLRPDGRDGTADSRLKARRTASQIPEGMPESAEAHQGRFQQA